MTTTKCPRNHGNDDNHGEAQPPHPCPFQSDVNNDSKTLCECCAKCEQACCDDV